MKNVVGDLENNPPEQDTVHAKHLSYGFCLTSNVINTNVININNLMDSVVHGECLPGKILAKVVFLPLSFVTLDYHIQ